MWVQHTRLRVKDGQHDAYVRWATAECRLQLQAPGFVKRTLLRSQTDPAVVYDQSFWDEPWQPVAFERGTAVAALRQAHAPADALLAASHQEACDIVFDERAEPGVEADARHPWTFHATVHVQPGGQAVYERWKVAEGVGQRAARGFIKRTLLRSQAEPTIYYYQSFWEAEACSHAYSRSEAFTEPFGRLNPAPVFAVPMLREDCDILLDAAADGSAAT